jgi:hypothetical protein
VVDEQLAAGRAQRQHHTVAHEPQHLIAFISGTSADKSIQPNKVSYNTVRLEGGGGVISLSSGSSLKLTCRYAKS